LQRIRQSWSKVNLYFLAEQRRQQTLSQSFFQQKWEAKRLTRAYHGEQIREKKWHRLFDRWIPSVVPMDPMFLAEHDGSNQAAGRGSGSDADLEIAQRHGLKQITPYMQMTYWVLERRLDTALFRAMFSSSVRQARQMVIHGHVKVNGKKVCTPTMYSVEC
jgi:ribosomal protein S4